MNQLYIYIYIFPLFQILFPQTPLQSIEQSSLCYLVGPYQLLQLLFILYTLEWVLGTEPYISIQITPPCLQGISQSSTHLWGKRVCNKVKFLLSFQFQDLTLAPLAALQFFWNDSAQFSLQWCVSSISHQLFFLICNLVVNTYLYARKINKT